MLTHILYAYTYIHTYIHTYINIIYIHTYIHTSMKEYMYMYATLELEHSFSSLNS